MPTANPVREQARAQRRKLEGEGARLLAAVAALWWLLAPLWGAAALAQALSRAELRRARLKRLKGAFTLGLPPPDDPFLCDSRPLVWLHGVSLGEQRSALALARHLLAERDLRVLLTSSTLSAQATAGRNLPQGARWAVLPLDHPQLAARFLKRWQPAAALFVEGDLWPGLCSALARRNVPIALASARHGPKSRRRWARHPRLARALYGRVGLALLRTQDDEAYFAALGVQQTALAGDLKDAAAGPPPQPQALSALAPFFCDRPRLAAVSLHEDELAPLLAAHRDLAAQHEGLLTVVCPRHPMGALREASLRRLKDSGLAFSVRSRGEEPPAGGGIYFADTFGEVELWCALVPAVFLGGTLNGKGGHNLREPARAGCMTVSGPSLHNQAAAAEALSACGGLAVRQAEELAEALAPYLLSAGAGGEAARTWAEGLGREVLVRSLAELESFIGPLPPRKDRRESARRDGGAETAS